MTLLAFVMTAMAYLAPGRDHYELASAIAAELEEAAPLFANDDDRTKTAALIVAVAFRESTFRNDAVGDDGHSVCAFQIYDGPRTLLEDARACVRTGVGMLRVSARVDRLNPIAFYARGPRFATEQAKRISRDRVALAERVRTAATKALEEAMR